MSAPVCAICGVAVGPRDYVIGTDQYLCLMHCPVFDQQLRIRVRGERLHSGAAVVNTEGHDAGEE